MAALPFMEIPRYLLTLVNSLYEVERKLLTHGDQGNVQRNVDRMKAALLEPGLVFEDPMGQRFQETRTDLEATISGESADNLVVVEVIKPIIRIQNEGLSRVVQRGIVVVQSESKGVDSVENDQFWYRLGDDELVGREV